MDNVVGKLTLRFSMSHLLHHKRRSPRERSTAWLIVSTAMKQVDPKQITTKTRGEAMHMMVDDEIRREVVVFLWENVAIMLKDMNAELRKRLPNKPHARDSQSRMQWSLLHDEETGVISLVWLSGADNDFKRLGRQRSQLWLLTRSANWQNTALLFSSQSSMFCSWRYFLSKNRGLLYPGRAEAKFGER